MWSKCSGNNGVVQESSFQLTQEVCGSGRTLEWGGCYNNLKYWPDVGEMDSREERLCLYLFLW